MHPSEGPPAPYGDIDWHPFAEEFSIPAPLSSGPGMGSTDSTSCPFKVEEWLKFEDSQNMSQTPPPPPSSPVERPRRGRPRKVSLARTVRRATLTQRRQQKKKHTVAYGLQTGLKDRLADLWNIIPEEEKREQLGVETGADDGKKMSPARKVEVAIAYIRKMQLAEGGGNKQGV